MQALKKGLLFLLLFDNVIMDFYMLYLLMIIRTENAGLHAGRPAAVSSAHRLAAAFILCSIQSSQETHGTGDGSLSQSEFPSIPHEGHLLFGLFVSNALKVSAGVSDMRLAIFVPFRKLKWQKIFFFYRIAQNNRLFAGFEKGFASNDGVNLFYVF